MITIDDGSDKENAPSLVPQSRTSPAASSNILKPSTATPLARLAWQDLMVTNDSSSKEEEDSPPSDRLLWHTDRDSLASIISPMLTRKGKKRARSSSPTSSPSNSKPNTPAVNVRRLREALKCQHADPALELWDRLSLNKVADDTPGIANPVLAHLMASSPSRRSNDGAAVQSESGLRRAISCGTHWPKRRRVEKPGADSPSRRSPHKKEASSKDSMVTALLQSVNGEITKSNALQTRRQTQMSPSPTKRTGRDQSISPPRKQGTSRDIEDAAPYGRVQATTSDYGDDDFDEDTILELDNSLLHVHTDEASSAHAPRSSHNIAPREAARQADAFHDEFGDLDDDVFAGAEDIIAEIESKHTSPSDNGHPRPANEAALRISDDPQGGLEQAEDLYGDDFGADFDFEAAECAATQSLKSPPAAVSLPNVRSYR